MEVDKHKHTINIINQQNNVYTCVTYSIHKTKMFFKFNCCLCRYLYKFIIA